MTLRESLLVFGSGWIPLACGCPGTTATPDAIDSASTDNGGEGADADDAGDGEGTDEGAEVAEPSFWFNPGPIPPCGDWEPAEVTAAREVPAAVDGLTLKWSYDLGDWPTDREWGIALSPTGAICAPVDGGFSVGCISSGGELEWSVRTSGMGHEIVGSLVVTPDGNLLAQTLYRELRMFRAYPPTPDSALGSVLWQFYREPAASRYPPERELIPAAFVAAGGYLFNEGPGGQEGLWLVDRCGEIRWILSGLTLNLIGSQAAVLGSELLAIGWPTGASPTLEPDGSYRGIHLYAVHSQGRLRDLPVVPTRGGIKPLGGDHGIMWQRVPRDDGTGLIAGYDMWQFDASGEILERSMLAAPISSPGAITILVHPDGGSFVGWRGLSDIAGDGAVASYGEGGALEMVATGPTLASRGMLMGRDGRVLAIGAERVLEEIWETNVSLIGLDGTIEDVLTVPVAEVHGESAILAEDGTLYLTGLRYGGVAILLAVQTPVPGFAPEDPGWTRFYGRNNRGDGWAR